MLVKPSLVPTYTSLFNVSSSWWVVGARLIAQPQRVSGLHVCFLLQCLTALLQNAMPLSAAIFKSEEKNPVPQCPPRLDVQTIQPVLWSRMPNSFLKVEMERVSERHGWMVQCLEPLQMMALHIPEENR